LTIRVLLVEDLKNIHDVVTGLLNTVGEFEVVGTVGTEAEAYLWLEENEGKWDLALVDLVLGQGTGLGVIPRAKMTPGTRVVVFSDYATEGLRLHCMTLGADAIFNKGSEVPDLLAWCGRLAQGDLPAVFKPPA
jgi:DNA-binding NarL/FixJ family response regulator